MGHDGFDATGGVINMPHARGIMPRAGRQIDVQGRTGWCSSQFNNCG